MPQRTIKYRGKVGGEWWHVTPEDAGWARFWTDVDKSTVGQFTGQTDTNGRQAYEGDIVKAVLLSEPYSTYTTEVTEQVVIDEEGFLAPFFMRVNYEEDWWKDCLKDGFEIIGDVYENPELVRRVL